MPITFYLCETSEHQQSTAEQAGAHRPERGNLGGQHGVTGDAGRAAGVGQDQREPAVARLPLERHRAGA
jgi:hypothetical protein